MKIYPTIPAGPDRPVLDDPVLSSLRGAHAELAEINGDALRYRPDVSPFAALVGGPVAASPRSWDQLAELAGEDGAVRMAGDIPRPPRGWSILRAIPGVQMVGDGRSGGTDPRVRPLGPADVPEMLDLVARTEPGPFRARTIELGSYLGIRQGDALVAMAGERMRPDGWTEISAVCTDPAHRGRGLASTLIQAVAAGIRARGEVPFLHAAASNAGAIRLYEALGFSVRRQVAFTALRAPGPTSAGREATT